MDTSSLQDLAALLAHHFSHGDAYESTQTLKTFLGAHGHTLTVYPLDNAKGQGTVCEAVGARWWILEWATKQKE